MLAVPLKRAQASDVANPLHEYLMRTFDSTKANLYLDSYSAFAAARENFLRLSEKRTTGLQDIDVITRYLRALAVVDAKFPVNENEMKMKFVWHDSFQLSTKFEYTRLSAERAATLFNLAALHSRVAITLDRSNDHNLNQACDLFRMAGTIFTFLKQEFLVENSFGATTADLSSESLNMLSNMMIAQAQVCVFERGIKNKMSSSVLSKLAKGSSELYMKAFNLTQTRHLHPVLAPSWGNHLLYQSLSFKASSEKHHALHVAKLAQENAEGFGENIAWLQACIQSSKKALQLAAEKKLPISVQRPVQAMAAEVEKLLAAAIDDNRKIYLEVVPPQSSLKPIESKIIVNPQPERIDPIWKSKIELRDEKDDDIFFGLLPLAVEIVVSQFEKRVNEMASSIDRSVKDGVASVRSMLKEANLPMLIEAGEKAVEGIPDETFARIIAVVQERGGVRGLLELLDDNLAKNNGLKEVVDGVLGKLQKDQDDFTKFKSMYGEKWSIPDASESTGLMRKDCLKFKGYLTEGGKNDLHLRQKVSEGELATLFAQISMNKDEMDKLMPSDSDVDDDPVVEEKRTTLRFSYIELDEKLVNAGKELQNLKLELSKGAMNFAKGLVERDDINAIVSDTSTLDEMIDLELTKYVESVSQVQQLVDGFSSLLSRVLDDSAKYMQSRKNNAVSEVRVSVLQRLEQGIVEFDNISKNIDQGRGFYADLTVKIEKVKGLVEDHVMSRELISSELAEALKGQERAPSANNDQAQGRFAQLSRQPSEPILFRPENPPQPSPVPMQRQQQQQQQPGILQPQPYTPHPTQGFPSQAQQQYNPRPYFPQPGAPSYGGGHPYGQAPAPPSFYPAQGYGHPPPNQGYGNGYPPPGGAYGGYGAPSQGYYAPNSQPYQQQPPPPQGGQNQGQGGQPGRFERMFSRRYGY